MLCPNLAVMRVADSEFMRIQFSGGRFKRAELPFFILKDLTRLQKMVIDIAKWLFKEKNEHVPIGFDQTYLKIVKLQEGSTVVGIDIDTTRPILDDVPVPNQEHFEAAANSIVDVISLVGQETKHLHDHIPDQYIDHFKHMGRDLQSNEIVEIISPNMNRARLTQKFHKYLVHHLTYGITQDMTIRGAIYEVDLKNMKFRLEPIHGMTCHCPFLDEHQETVVNALAKYKSRKDLARVRVQVTGVYDKQGRLQAESVKSVEPLNSLDVDARLDEFRNLQDNWLEDGGVAPNHDGLNWLSGIFARYYPTDLRLPRTYPTADGGVSLEWSSGAQEIDIEIDLEKHTGEWYVFNSDTKRGEDEKKLDLDKPDDWKWIGTRLRDLIG